MLWTAIDKYLVRHYTRQSGQGLDQTLANIICYKDHRIVGYLNFFLEGQIPESSFEPVGVSGDKMYRLNFDIARIGEVLETLRQEKPIHIAFNPSYSTGTVGTGAEPVGEEEGA